LQAICKIFFLEITIRRRETELSMTLVTGYCAIFDYDFSDIIYAEGVDPSGGAQSVEEITVAGRKYGDVREKGRQPKKYKVKARSLDRDEIEAFLRTCNTLPDEAEFFPFDAERMGYIASAFAAIQPIQRAGSGYNFYEAVAEITCREAWLYGPDQGIDFKWWEPLPSVSDTLTNAGHERAPISYMQCSGDYSGGYAEDLSVRIVLDGASGKDRELALCEKMLRNDLFELGWRGEARHTYEYNCDRSLAALSIDLHGLVSDGIWLGDRVLLDNGDYIMIPFYGPLPVAGTPGSASLQLDIEAVSGGAVQVAEEIDLSDIAEVDHDALVVGSQTIPVPDLQGKSLVIIGIKADVDPFEPFAGPTFGNCRDITVAPDGSIYVASDLGDLWHWAESAGWTLESNVNLATVSVSAEGTVYGTLATGSYDLVKWAGGDTWTQLAGAHGSDVAARTDTDLWAVGTDTHIWHYTGSWADTGITALRISVSPDGTLYYVGTDYQAYYISDGAGVSIGGSAIVDIAAVSADTAYASVSAGTVWKYNGSWSQVPDVTGIDKIASSCYGVLAGTTTSASMWQRPYILLSKIKGVVNRYIAPSKIPWADPDDDFQIRVESSNGNRLKFLQVCWQNRYWY
jgi:hypothetical protein